MAVTIYGAHPDREAATALTTRRINHWRRRWGLEGDLRQSFALAEAIHYQSPSYDLTGTLLYGVRVLTVEVAGEIRGYIVVKRNGQLAFRYVYNGDSGEDETSTAAPEVEAAAPPAELLFHGPEVVQGWMLPIAPEGYTWLIEAAATAPIQRCMRCRHCELGLHRTTVDGEWFDVWNQRQCSRAPLGNEGNLTGHVPGTPVVDRPEPRLIERSGPVLSAPVIPRILMPRPVEKSLAERLAAQLAWLAIQRPQVVDTSVHCSDCRVPLRGNEITYVSRRRLCATCAPSAPLWWDDSSYIAYQADCGACPRCGLEDCEGCTLWPGVTLQEPGYCDSTHEVWLDEPPF